ncbi:hypothetical protein AB4423_15975 [Vibrio chagasii]|uniref:hypothetical protein n=3 Tax=Vibrio TaxID=662 RepID=UPI00354D176C
MSTKRKCKIFINDVEVLIQNSKQSADTVSGKMYVTMTDIDVPDEKSTSGYFINTARPMTDCLDVWLQRFKGSLKSHREYAKLNKDIKVATGNIIKTINAGDKGKKAIGCFIAVFDKQKISFEVHYNSPKLFYVEDVVTKHNIHNQRETELLTLSEGNTNIASLFPVTQSKATVRRRTNSKLTLQDEEDILHALKMGNKQKDIAARFQVSQPIVSKLKAKFTSQGLLK